MLPEIWGKHAWNFIHLTIFGYPVNPSQQDKINYFNFFNDLQFVLPCDKCRFNLSQHLKKIPLTNEILSDRSLFIKWGIDLHNMVNYYTGKPILSYNKALDEINKLVNPKKSNNLFLIIMIIIVVLCIFYYLWKKS